MFNYDAQQVFVIHPRSTGGGIVSFLLSLGSNTASIDMRDMTTQAKLARWQEFLKSDPENSHMSGFVNFGHPEHAQCIENADHCGRYVHKCHFYELDHPSGNHPLLQRLSADRPSIGIYVTDQCVDRLLGIRPNTPPADYYQTWVYSKQANLLKTFYGISSLHTFSFSEMLDIDVFLDHLKYCNDLLDIDTSLDLYRSVIQQWYRSVLKI